MFNKYKKLVKIALDISLDKAESIQNSKKNNRANSTDTSINDRFKASESRINSIRKSIQNTKL